MSSDQYRLIHVLIVALRVLAGAFWIQGVVRGSDALRIASDASVPSWWVWVSAVFSLVFFFTGSWLWFGARYANRFAKSFDDHPSNPRKHRTKT